MNDYDKDGIDIKIGLPQVLLFFAICAILFFGGFAAGIIQNSPILRYLGW